MPAEHEPDQLDQWLTEQVPPLPPPPGTFELITRRARRRKVRKALISAASAAAVAAAVAVAVPVGLSLNLNPATSASLSSGSSAVKAGGPAAPNVAGPTRTAPGPGSTAAPRSGPQSVKTTPTATGSAAANGGLSAPGSLPADFTPSSVTWDSLSSGWVIGQAGTAGHCANANPDICTSIAHTSDGGQTWSGLPAPSTGGPESATGVTGLRFLNATYGWAFGPELWATGNGGQSWHQVSTGSLAVTDLETSGQRAYALFASCSAPAGSSGDTIASCTSYTLMTAVAGSDDWTAVSGIPAGLAPGDGSDGSAQLVLAGSNGYLTGPDGTLYAGPLDGGAWHTMSALPCIPGAAASDGLPDNVMLAAAGTTASGQTRLALACASATPLASTVVYWSDDGGTTWVKQASAGTGGTVYLGSAQSLAATTDGTLILATEGSGNALGGIYYLSPGGSQWRAAALSSTTGTNYGFSYVGMTSAKQGVALGGSPSLHAIWMTTDGGQTWQVRPVTS
jgi:hypothetical protein